MFVGFPDHFTAEPAENAENSPYFLCEFGDLCGERNVTPPLYSLPFPLLVVYWCHYRFVEETACVNFAPNMGKARSGI